MKIKTKHRKLFYVPGMISLVLIPVLCLWFIKTNRYLTQYKSVSFNISDSITNIKPSNAYIPSNKGYIPKRDYKTYIFNGDNDEQKLKDLLFPLQQMVKENDTLTGFKFHFVKNSTYQTFISAQDLLFVCNVGVYTFYQDDIYAFEMPKEKPKTKAIPIILMRTCGYEEANKDFLAEQQRKAERELLAKNIKLFWQIPFAMLGMIVLNLYFLIKFNRNRKYNQKSYI